MSSEKLDGKRGPRENVIPGTHCTAELMTEIILDNIKHAFPLHRCNDKMVCTQLTKKHPELIKHLECWAHVRTKFKNAFKVSNDPMADWFVKQIGRLYLVEAECFLKGLSAEETKYRRNRREVTRILESIKSKAEELLSRQRIHYSPALRRALNYMKRGWENLIRYREDGDYSIDNSIAERAVRPYTVFRNGTMFHGSERGVENTTFFYSLIETGKARGLNVKNYLVSMIREMLHVNTDYKGILQGAYI